MSDGEMSADRSALSADGRFVLFSRGSFSPDGGVTNAFLRDRQEGTTGPLRVPQVQATQLVWTSMSADGRWISLTGWEANLGAPAVFLFDRTAGSILRIATGHTASLSADGRWTLFQTDAALADGDDNAARDLYVFERGSRAFERIDLVPGVTLTQWTTPRAISADGRFVLFESCEALIVEDDTNDACDVFRYDRLMHVTQRINVNTEGVQSNAQSYQSTMSDDGQIVAFASGATNLVPADENGERDVFVRDVSRGVTARVSIGSLGLESNGQSDSPAISADGRFVAFASSARNLAPLVPYATIFVHDRTTGVTRIADLGENGGHPPGGSFQPAISGNGRYVSFTTYAALETEDTDHNLDVYLRDLGTRTPEDELASVLSQIEGLDPGPMRTDLQSLADQAFSAVQRNDRARACDALHAFAYAVQAAWNRDLASPTAGRLFAAAEDTRLELGCPPGRNLAFSFVRSQFRLPEAPWFGLALGDFNADGNVDAAVSHAASVSILAGEGHGSFAAPISVPTGALPRGIASADLNGDGFVDLLVANQDDSSVSVLLARGREIAFARSDLPTGRNPVQVTSGDFTGDGVPDIVVANASEYFLSLYRGRGDGSFEAIDDLYLGYSPTSVAVADLNGDESNDLVVAGWGAVSTFLGTTQGQLQFSNHLAFGSMRQLEVADFNDDGLTDLAFIAESVRVHVLVNQGRGQFIESMVLDVPDAFFMASGDLDGDARRDLIVTTYSPSGFWIFTGNNDGTFGRRERFSRDVGSSVVVTHDVNNDGAADVLVLATTARTPPEEQTAHPSLNILLNRPPVSVETPNTAENWAIGSERTVRWRHRVGRDTIFRVDLSRDNGRTWTALGTVPATGPSQFNWTVSGPPSRTVRFRVSALGRETAVDINDAPVVVSAPFVQLNQRTAVEWGIGSSQLIGWTHNLGSKVPTTIEMSRDGGVTWAMLGEVLTSASEGAYWRWMVTGPPTRQATIRVRAGAGIAAGTLNDVTIAKPFVRMLPLRLSTPWNACELREVRWVSNLGRSERVFLDVSHDLGLTWHTVADERLGKVSYAPPQDVPYVTVRARWGKNASVSAALGPFHVLTTPVPNWCDDGQ